MVLFIFFYCSFFNSIDLFLEKNNDISGVKEFLRNSLLFLLTMYPFIEINLVILFHSSLLYNCVFCYLCKYKRMWFRMFDFMYMIFFLVFVCIFILKWRETLFFRYFKYNARENNTLFMNCVFTSTFSTYASNNNDVILCQFCLFYFIEILDYKKIIIYV